MPEQVLHKQTSPADAGVHFVKNESRRVPAMSGLRMRRWHRRAKLLGAVAVAGSVVQGTGCIPDPIGAFNFEAQNLISGLLINAFDIVVRNILHL